MPEDVKYIFSTDQEQQKTAPQPKRPDEKEVKVVSYTPKSFDADKYAIIEDKTLANLPADASIWIRYYKPDGKLVGGGQLIRNMYPQYLILLNPYDNFRWSVQCKAGNRFMVMKKSLPEIKKSIIKNELYSDFINRN